jgi:hypothetical protein
MELKSPKTLARPWLSLASRHKSEGLERAQRWQIEPQFSGIKKPYLKDKMTFHGEGLNLCGDPADTTTGSSIVPGVSQDKPRRE